MSAANVMPSTLAAALVKAQHEVESATMDAHNSDRGYAYATAEEIVRTAKVALKKAGLAVYPAGLDLKQEGENLTMVRVWTLLHETGASWCFPVAWPVHVSGPRDKAVAAASTFGLGYFLRDLLLIPRELGEGVDARKESPRALKPEPEKVKARDRNDAAPAPKEGEPRTVSASVVLKDRLPPSWGTHKGAPHTVPKDASMPEHLGLAPGDGLPATSLEERAHEVLEHTRADMALSLAASAPKGSLAALLPVEAADCLARAIEHTARTSEVVRMVRPSAEQLATAANESTGGGVSQTAPSLAGEGTAHPSPGLSTNGDTAAPLSPAVPTASTPEVVPPSSGVEGPDWNRCPTCKALVDLSGDGAFDGTEVECGPCNLRLVVVALDDGAFTLDYADVDDPDDEDSPTCAAPGCDWLVEVEGETCAMCLEGQPMKDAADGRDPAEADAAPLIDGAAARALRRAARLAEATPSVSEMEPAPTPEDWGEATPIRAPAPKPAYRPPTSEFSGKKTMTAPRDMGPCALPGAGCSGEIKNLDHYHAGKKGRRAHVVCVTRERRVTEPQATAQAEGATTT